MRSGFFVIVGLLAVGAVLLILYENTSLFTGSSDENQINVTERIEEINIRTHSSDMKIVPEARDDVKAVLTGNGELSLRQKGDTIEVEVKKKWYQFLNFNNDSDVTVFLPEDFKQNLKLEVGSGNLALHAGSPLVLNDVEIQMSSGDVELSNLQTKRFEHDGSSGRLTIDQLTTKDGRFDISSGDVILTNYSGPIEGDMSSGEMNVQMTQLTGDVSFDLSSGDVELDLPDNADFTLDTEASSGDISTSFNLKDQTVSNKKISGVHGSGKYQVKISLSSGNARVY
ncbi:LiaG family protein [Guptibacillus hwajinpoensis]|uniref:LiaG family protein n=1 Tax=Guptibacillus hwajinpoensis TaxID=208199 RepID=UPI001CFD8705